MKNFCFLILMLSISLFAQEKPKLVVGIVVDQMKADYLYQFQNDYNKGGFKRLMKKGYNFKDMQYNYVPTYTAPGHSSIYTGTTPSVHGIVGNYWYHKSEKQNVYCTADLRYETVGDNSDEKAGRMSPFRLETTTITDQLKLATNMRSKVIGISIKDRGAILPAGHYANNAFWMNNEGNFISSSYYKKTLPEWVVEYNSKNQTENYINKGWDLLLDESNYTESISDNNNYEVIFKGTISPTFPYNLKEIQKQEGNKIIKSTPYGNDMVTELAIEALKNEQLGKGDYTDFLAISFSSTDYVGHSFGPRSKELQDTYIRLDRNIETILKTLDQELGKGNYLVFLTADHAVADIPTYLNDHKYFVETLVIKDLKQEITDYLKSKFGINLVEEYKNQNLFLNHENIKIGGLDYEDVLLEAQEFFMKKESVKRAYSREEILEGNVNDYHLSMIARGFDPKQNGDVFVHFKPAYFEGYGPKGTTHGTSYNYDTHVPCLWFGWNIKSGSSVQRKTITQIAPTLAMLLNINMPNASKDEVLTELFQKN